MSSNMLIGNLSRDCLSLYLRRWGCTIRRIPSYGKLNDRLDCEQHRSPILFWLPGVREAPRHNVIWKDVKTYLCDGWSTRPRNRGRGGE